DHVEASHLVERACYASGAGRFAAPGERHRPGLLMFALYRSLAKPQVVIDVTRVWEKKSEAIRAHETQLAPAAGPSTYLTHEDFLPEIEAQARVWGASIGARYGEGYRLRRPFGVVATGALFP